MNNIKHLLNLMSLEEKVGQLFHIGFPGKTVTNEIKEMIENYHIGGIIYFRRNIDSMEQVALLSNLLQKLALKNNIDLPLFISTDQEGGTVIRLKGATHFPGQMAIGATYREKLAEEAGRTIAQELKSVGINMNFAPVLDVNYNPNNLVIGVRSFGSNPELVANMGKAYIKGIQGEGVIACGKHFPGHGDTDLDSHLSLPIINVDQNRLEKVELYPFKMAIESGLDSIMTAHVYFPAIEKEEGIPSTLSQAVLTSLLRRELNYDGLIITDCMEMNAIVSTFGTIEGAVMTIEAGSDMVLISHTIEKAKAAIAAVIKAVEKGRISEKRINSSVERIIKLKKKRIEKAIVENNVVNTENGNKVAYNIAKKAVTLVKDEKKLLPVKEEAKILVCDFTMGRISLVEDDKKHENLLIEDLKAENLDVKHHTFHENIQVFPDIIGYDLIIVCTYDAVNNQDQVEIIQKMQKQTNNLLVIAVRNPYDLKVLPGIDTFMTTYDFSPLNFKVASEIIVGKSKAEGKLPIIL